MRFSHYRSWLSVGAAATIVAAAGAVSVTAAPTAQATAGCQVEYSVSSQWQGGFGANVSITNLGSPTTGWTLTWTFSAGQTITQLWNGSDTQTGGDVAVTNAPYNGAIPTGGSTSFGFNGSWSTSNPAPTSFALNGTTCTGSGPSGTPTTTPSSSPSSPPSSTPSTPSSTPSSTPATRLPCDIYAAGGTPCVAAHSTVRALYAAYGGALYQVRRASDNATKDIGALAPGGYANAAAQDSFCSGTSCVITVVYDQSGHGNSVAYQGPGGAGGNDTPSSATRESLTAAGHKVYDLYINPGNSYWHNGASSGMPLGSQPQGAYMVTSGIHVNSGCCFDYGNSETDRRADGAGAMDAINFSTSCWFGGCSGTGPWVQADLEYGLFPGGSSSWNQNQRAFNNKYVTAMLKNNGTTQMALKGGNAQTGSLTTLWNGTLPPGYNPMKQQGAIILGSGGDCCASNTNQSLGTFYEGAITAGYPSDATDNAVQASIVGAGYQ